MNLSLLIWMALAVCLAWAVGAYSRLNRMREQVLRARASLLKYCKQYAAWMSEWDTQVGLLQDGLASVSVPVSRGGLAPLGNLVAAITALQQPIEAWESQLTGEVHQAELGRALDAVQSCVEAIASAPEDLAGALWPTEERNRWLGLVADVRLRRNRYNVYASEMNEAVGQMPAALIARLAGIGPWGQV
ncbi:MAG: hypothetical protein E6Q78_17205 [Rhodoferax sp.]|nr:MAG: hypothetical protein E6Q78_17205 [Rhodoferax sp.]